ncbi:MAG: wax ester/triacylglycerol synthase family O-acyltransferase [Frankiales bacterium]|nr:wax ester/triacylglycerol synthase family O-acyltransferase [Frankiales bacterium]
MGARTFGAPRGDTLQQLSGLDAAFLAMETSAVYGHVGSVCVLDPSTAPEPLTLERLQGVISSRLHLVPPLRRRLAEVPFGFDQPYWIETPTSTSSSTSGRSRCLPPATTGSSPSRPPGCTPGLSTAAGRCGSCT